MKKLIIGGVPEHFNFPWKWAIHNGDFQQRNVDLEWIDYPKGTGDMTRALREKEIDMAVILTEGIVRDIVNGNPSKIVQVYVESPLLWGIHVASNSDYQSVEDLKGTHAAISRFGSGSHLMAYVNAQNYDWNLEKDLKFEVVNDLQGAIESLPEGKGDYFMWEKFMTKPFVDNGLFRLVGEAPTPWPSFVVVVRDDVLEDHRDAIATILETINTTTKGFKNIPMIAEFIAMQFNQRTEDVLTWLSITDWSQIQLSNEEVEDVQNKLYALGLIDQKVESNKILHNF